MKSFKRITDKVLAFFIFAFAYLILCVTTILFLVIPAWIDSL